MTGDATGARDRIEVFDRVAARAAEAQQSKRKDWERLQQEAPDLCAFALELSKRVGKVSIVVDGVRYGQKPAERNVPVMPPGITLSVMQGLKDERLKAAFNQRYAKSKT